MHRVYVLGAGASRALNSRAPLMKDLLRIGINFSQGDRPPSPSTKSAHRVKEFISEFYSPLNFTNILPPFEDVLSQVDYCIVNNIPLSKKYSVDELRSLRKDLIYILGRAIQHETNHQTDHALVGTFFNNLDQHTETIISLNYDLIIDNGFRDFFGFVNYGVTMRNSVHFRPQYPPKLTLYKLHGSLNWLYCPVCGALETTEGEKGALKVLTEDINCQSCNTPFEPVLNTPTFLKDYNNSYIVELWRNAQTQLHHADEVVFVGYSMPDADIVLRMFFTRALYTNRLLRGHQNRCKVRVVDYTPNMDILAGNSTKTRYEQLFGEIDFDSTGFIEYISRGCKTQQQIQLQ